MYNERALLEADGDTGEGSLIRSRGHVTATEAGARHAGPGSSAAKKAPRVREDPGLDARELPGRAFGSWDELAACAGARN